MAPKNHVGNDPHLIPSTSVCEQKMLAIWTSSLNKKLTCPNFFKYVKNSSSEVFLLSPSFKSFHFEDVAILEFYCIMLIGQTVNTKTRANLN